MEYSFKFLLTILVVTHFSPLLLAMPHPQHPYFVSNQCMYQEMASQLLTSKNNNDCFSYHINLKLQRNVK